MGESLQILYRDAHLIAVYKPAGLLVHRSSIDRQAPRFAMQMLRDQIGARVYPLHRLDRPTAGLLLFGLDAETARRMGRAFEANRVEKTYLALVRGYAPRRIRIEYPLKEEPDPVSDRLATPDKPAQPAVTRIDSLAEVELPYSDGRHPSSRYSLVRARPLTGRKHQIRRHLKHIFHPVIGDTTYGDGRHNRLFRERFGCHRLLLAAVGLSFDHPYQGSTVRIKAPLDEEFRHLLERLALPHEFLSE